jgi:hypothetical protein
VRRLGEAVTRQAESGKILIEASFQVCNLCLGLLEHLTSSLLWASSDASMSVYGCHFLLAKFVIRTILFVPMPCNDLWYSLCTALASCRPIWQCRAEECKPR